MTALANPSTTSPLTNPSHAQLHTDTNTAVVGLGMRLDALEGAVPRTAQDIEHARLAAHQWTLRGDLVPDHKMLLPIIWNITGRTVTFEAAKITVLTPADADVVVDIVVGTALDGPMHDHDSGLQTSILKTPLVIPAGAFFSPTVSKVNDDFVGVQLPETYLAAFCEGAGSPGAPGRDLTIQLNRLL
jgi:hypothetical protein